MGQESLIRHRLGELDKLSLQILIDILGQMDENWYDEFEKLIDHTDLELDSEDEAVAEAAMDKYDAEMEKLQLKVMRRVGKALFNWSNQIPDRLVDRAWETLNTNPNSLANDVPDEPPPEIRGPFLNVPVRPAPLQADPEPPFLNLPEF